MEVNLKRKFDDVNPISQTPKRLTTNIKNRTVISSNAERNLENIKKNSKIEYETTTISCPSDSAINNTNKKRNRILN